jgi:hypothetical protein
LCGLHRRETLSGRRSRPNTVAPIRATPQFVSPKGTPKAPPHGSSAPIDPLVNESAAMTDDAEPGPSALAKAPHQKAAPVATVRRSPRTSRSPLKRGRPMEGAVDPSVAVSRRGPTTSTLSAGLSGAQTGMPPPQARATPIHLHGTVSGWQPRMSGGRQGRPTSPPPLGEDRSRRRGHSAPGAGKRAHPSRIAGTDRQVAAHPPTSGWRDEWTITDADSKNGDITRTFP